MSKAPDIAGMRRNPMKFFEAVWIPSGVGPARFCAIMADFQRERFAGLIPDLIAVAAWKKPPHGMHWWEATKGASKDSDLALALLWLILFANRKLHIRVGADDKEQAAELKEALDSALKMPQNKWIDDQVGVYNWEVRSRRTGSKIEIVAVDATGSHGRRPDVTVINELSHIRNREFAETLMDDADKVPHGLRIIATNAGYQGTWQWAWRQQFLDSGAWLPHVFSRPSPWISQQSLDGSKRRNSLTRYNRLWWGVWSEGEGDAFDASDLAAARTQEGPIYFTPNGWLAVQGLDLGVKHDHAALCTLLVKPGCGRVRLAQVQSWKPEESTGKVDLPAVREACRETYKKFGSAWFGYDPHQAELMAMDLSKAGLPVQEVPFTAKSCDQMARDLLEAFRGKFLDLYDDPDFYADLHRLHIVERRWGYKLEAPSDRSGHADRAIAFAIALPVALEIANDPSLIVATEPEQLCYLSISSDSL